MKTWARKGNVLFTIAELVIAAVVVFLFINGALNVATGTASQRNFLANDIATTMSTLHSVPGDATYTYEQESLQKYKFTIQTGLVKVSEPEASVMGEAVQTIAAYPGAEKEMMSTVIVFAPNLQLVKTGKLVHVQSSPEYQMQEEQAPDIATSRATCSGDCG